MLSERLHALAPLLRLNGANAVPLLQQIEQTLTVLGHATMALLHVLRECTATGEVIVGAQSARKRRQRPCLRGELAKTLLGTVGQTTKLRLMHRTSLLTWRLLRSGLLVCRHGHREGRSARVVLRFLHAFLELGSSIATQRAMVHVRIPHPELTLGVIVVRLTKCTHCALILTLPEHWSVSATAPDAGGAVRTDKRN